MQKPIIEIEILKTDSEKIKYFYFKIWKLQISKIVKESKKSSNKFCFLQEENMTAAKVVLLRILEDLNAEELKKFKWYLQQDNTLEDFPPIPKSRLENADRMDTVDQMVLTYSINTPKVANIVLGLIYRNDLVGKLSQQSLESAGES